MNANNHLRQYVEKIETLLEERAEVQGRIKDVYAEAKGNGFQPKIIRKVIALRAKGKQEREAEAALIETYLSALDMI